MRAQKNTFAFDQARSSSRARRGAGRLFPTALVLAAGSFVVSACAGSEDKQVLPPVVLAMLETTTPAFDDGEDQIFQVTREVRLPFRRPTDAERPTGAQDPYARPPFQVATDSRVTIRYTLSNLDDQPHTVELLVDPWNEFVRYVPGVTMVRDDEVLPNLSGIDRYVIVPPKSRVEGIITPDDVVELATDLTTAMALDRRPPDAEGGFGGAVLYNRAFNVQNRSSEPDPVLVSWIPGNKAKVAAMIGFDLGLRTSEPAKLAVELVIDVQDLNGERVVEDGEDDPQIGRPGTALSPPASGPE